jgi:hypothetical protein
MILSMFKNLEAEYIFFEGLEGHKAMMHLLLCDNIESVKDSVMLVQVVAVDIPNSRPISESAIHCFMHCTAFFVFQPEVLVQIKEKLMGSFPIAGKVLPAVETTCAD